MSGPKAFRVVTRTEIILICRRNLASLDAAIADWTNSCQNNGTIGRADVDKVEARRAELHRLLAADRFVELQKQVPAEISFLAADARSRAEKAAQAEAQARQAERRLRTTAKVLLEQLRASGIDIPEETRRELSATSVPHQQLQSAVSKAFLLLETISVDKAASERQRSQAQQLGSGMERLSLQQWLARQPEAPEDAVALRIDKQLGEMKSLGVDPSPFSARLSALESEPPSRRSLLADSLLVDLARSIKEARDQCTRRSALRAVRAELELMSSAEAEGVRTAIDRRLDESASSDDADLLAKARTLIEAEVKAMAATARRRAVLQGLAQLGYEVSEGMETAWVSGGRVVVRKPANPGYGVELSGAAQSDLLQVRAIGIGDPSAPRDLIRDKDMETIWCGEFERLQSLVAKSGGDLAIEHARPAGAFPLKIVADALASTEEAASPKQLMR